MFKLWATIIKDIRILSRDKVGITLMFGMPIALVLIITSIQNSTFNLVNKSKVALLVCNNDTGKLSVEFLQAVNGIGMFKMQTIPKTERSENLTERMHNSEAPLAIVIPADFSTMIDAKAKLVSGKALNTFGLDGGKVDSAAKPMLPLNMYYKPALQNQFRQSVQGALYSALQVVQSKQILRVMYLAINSKKLPPKLEDELLNNKITITETPVLWDGSRNIPNASQHNVPSWTIFAMFFVVISLAGSIVREKLSGSFIRLKTLPTNYFVALLSKQITYLLVTLLQAAVIFAIGIWLFPYMGLPVLNLPADFGALVFVSLVCGWCAVSYAICIGVFAQTQEQANGFGAISIVMLAAIGGLMVPSFSMPESFRVVMKLSPLHWCLEAYYGLFLEGGKLKDVLVNIIPLLGITLVLQATAVLGLKVKKLI
ncbi:ABC-2 type transport system permease protein [Mucilaginibacter gracilis]|uniref:ABC-2 type transport system permease protein n=1 Tax=Mucilaginibacter gracilis TaxID=423350 RepID=A0A495J4R6_9SPHI|nr:ABC transporter permease [Mucilaginibacter gracilis]RKR83947.1 ABC-2 type transport system permease protein [Mucilaginibacter gracilis]